jgi:hypothetical protein
MSVVSTAKIVEDYAQQLGDWWYNNLDADEQAYLKKHRADKLPDEFAGMVRRAEAARRRHRDGQDQALPVAADGPCVRGDETARRRVPACRH